MFILIFIKEILRLSILGVKEDNDDLNLIFFWLLCYFYN